MIGLGLDKYDTLEIDTVFDLNDFCNNESDCASKDTMQTLLIQLSNNLTDINKTTLQTPRFRDDETVWNELNKRANILNKHVNRFNTHIKMLNPAVPETELISKFKLSPNLPTSSSSSSTTSTSQSIYTKIYQDGWLETIAKGGLIVGGVGLFYFSGGASTATRKVLGRGAGAVLAAGGTAWTYCTWGK